jgi:hypothetical protein
MAFAIHIKEKIKVRNVAEKYLSAILNNDFLGLEESEVKAVNRWKKKNLADIYSNENEQEAGFMPCSVSGLSANCLNVSCLTKEKIFPISAFQLYLVGLYMILENGQQLNLDRESNSPKIKNLETGKVMGLRKFIKTYCDSMTTSHKIGGCHAV